MARQISQCRLEAKTAPDTWVPVTTLHEAEWTGFAPAGCGVDQGRVIATPEDPRHALLDPDALDRQYRLLDVEGEPLFEFLGFVDDRRPRGKGQIILGLSSPPELLGAWRELQPAAG